MSTTSTSIVTNSTSTYQFILINQQQDESKRSRKYDSPSDHNENMMKNDRNRRLQSINIKGTNRCINMQTSSGGSLNSSSQTSSSSSDSSVILSRYPFVKRPLLLSTPISNVSVDEKREKEKKKDEQQKCIKFNHNKIVVAEYDFNPLNASTDLALSRSQEYQVINENIEGCTGWWIVKNKKGETGFVPANYVKEKRNEKKMSKNEITSSSSPSCDDKISDTPGNVYCDYRPEWFVPELDRFTCERILKSDGRVGAFIVRYSTSQCCFTISVVTKKQHSSNTCQVDQVKHYLIRETTDPLSFYLSENQRFDSLEQLINFHRTQAASLVTRLKYIPSLTSVVNISKSNAVTQMYRDKSWEIRASDLTLMEELGSGQFGVVRRGKWTRLILDTKCNQHKQVTLEIAVKLMKEGTMSGEFVFFFLFLAKITHHDMINCALNYLFPFSLALNL